MQAGDGGDEDELRVRKRKRGPHAVRLSSRTALMLNFMGLTQRFSAQVVGREKFGQSSVSLTEPLIVFSY
jgi:hypothetical protein